MSTSSMAAVTYMAAVAPTPYLVQQLIHADSEAEDVNLLGVLLVVVHLWRHVHEGAGAPTHEPLGLCGQLKQYRQAIQGHRGVRESRSATLLPT